MRENLDDVNDVFPNVVTCGQELSEWLESKTDLMDMFYASAITDAALMSGLKEIRKHIDEKYGTGTLGEMNPGALSDWPMEEQRPLFDLLGGDVEKEIGVKLKPTFLMFPTNSTAGLLFANVDGYNAHIEIV